VTPDESVSCARARGQSTHEERAVTGIRQARRVRQEGTRGGRPNDTAYLFAGEKTLALDWLERAYEARDPALPYLRLPLFDPLRSEPRFEALMRRMGLPQD
jgi:hypothetical protein